MDLTNIIVVVVAALLSFAGGFMARPKTKAEARKTEAEADAINTKRLYAEINRLDAQLTNLRTLLAKATRESNALCELLTSAKDEVTSARSEVILLRERMDKAATELDAGQTAKAEATLKKGDGGKV